MHVLITTPGRGRAQASNCIMLVLELPSEVLAGALSVNIMLQEVWGYRGAAAMRRWAVDCSE